MCIYSCGVARVGTRNKRGRWLKYTNNSTETSKGHNFIETLYVQFLWTDQKLYSLALPCFFYSFLYLISQIIFIAVNKNEVCMNNKIQ